MRKKLLLQLVVLSLLLLVFAVGSTAQLSGNYTIDPGGSGPFNYTTFAAASAALGAGISGPVVFTVASTTFNESVTLNPVTGASSTNTITFIATGSPATIQAAGPQGLTLQAGAKYFIFDNLEIKGATSEGIYMAYASPNRVEFCTFKSVLVDMPTTTSTSVNAVEQQQAYDITYENCKFLGGGRTFYAQRAYRCKIKACEFDGEGSAGQLFSLWNACDSGVLCENSFFHDCGPSGYAIYSDYSEYGVMYWHNTIIVTTTQVGVFLGSCCGWSCANSFRNNIVINWGTGGCIRYGYDGSHLDYNDLDYNCYYAPSGLVCELENGGVRAKNTLASWQSYFITNRAALVHPPGPNGPAAAQTRYDDNSIEANPSLVRMMSPYDIHLTSDSPCVDAGTTQYVAGAWMSFTPANYKVQTDFEGDIRPASNVDIGADEMSIVITGDGAGKIGTTVTLKLESASDAGLPYQVGSSFGNGPIPIDTRRLGLSLDTLLMVSIGAHLPTIFQNYAGLLDPTGKGSAKLNIPNIPALRGLKIYSAFLTLKAAAPSGVSNISNSFFFTIQ